jgi:hypothetical protein
VVWEGIDAVRGSGGLIALGDAVVPLKATLTFEGLSKSPDVLMRFEIRDQRPECVEISVKAKPDGRGIRDADIGIFHIDRLTINVFERLANLGARDEKVLLAASRSVHEARKARRGGVTRADLENVARIYQQHIGTSPTRAVALEYDFSERTAARRIKEAERVGLLPVTTPGRKRKA